MRNAWIVVVTVPVLFFMGCGGAEEETAPKPTVEAAPEQLEKMTKEAEKMIDQEMEKIQKKEAATFPCSLFPQEELVALVGNPLTPGSYAFEHVSEGENREYRRESCTWSPAGAEGNQVSLKVSLAQHFDKGSVICFPPLDAGANNPWAPKKISGIGDEAWWQYGESSGGATLVVCSAKALAEVNVGLTGNDEALARKIALTMAEKVLATQ